MLNLNNFELELQGFYQCHLLEHDIANLVISKIKCRNSIPFQIETQQDFTRRINLQEFNSQNISYQYLFQKFLHEIKDLQMASVNYTDLIRQISQNIKISQKQQKHSINNIEIEQLNDQFQKQINDVFEMLNTSLEDHILGCSQQKCVESPITEKSTLKEENLNDFEKQNLIKNVLFRHQSPRKSDSPIPLPNLFADLDYDQFETE